MSYPCINQSFVQINSFLNRFIPCLVIRISIKLLCAICSSHEVNDGFVPSISELNCIPTSFIQDGLPNILVTICGAVHDSSIADDDGWGVTCLRNLSEDIFKLHLESHQRNLKFDGVRKCHFWCLDESTSVHEYCGCFGHQKHSVANLFQM